MGRLIPAGTGLLKYKYLHARIHDDEEAEMPASSGAEAAALAP